MNGYRYRRSAGSASSRRQSAHVAVSADTRVPRRPVGPLAAMVNDSDPVDPLRVPGDLGGMSVAPIRSILASGGASRCNPRRNFLTSSAGPSTSTNTPSASLPTNPDRPSPVASVYTNGRKPTPCTIPSTRIAVRTTAEAPIGASPPARQTLTPGARDSSISRVPRLLMIVVDRGSVVDWVYSSATCQV